MAITRVGIIHGSSKLRVTGGKREFRRQYRVRSDVQHESEVAILEANDGTTAIPPYGDEHPADPDAVVVDIEVTSQADGGYEWRVDVRWSNDANVISGSQQIDTPPLQRPFELSYGTTVTEIPLIKDLSASPVPVLNSLGQPFDPQPTREVNTITMTLSRNVLAYNPNLAYLYRGSVNDAAINVVGYNIAAGQAKLVRWDATFTRETYSTATGPVDSQFYRETYEIHLLPNPLDHQLQVLNTGVLHLVGTELVPITDKSGTPVDRPQVIDIATGEAILDPTPAQVDANLLTFTRCPARTWSLLGLPTA